MSSEEHPPDITETAFECPFCGAYTTQTWYTLMAQRISGENETPFVYTSGLRERIEKDENLDPTTKASIFRGLDQIDSGQVTFMESESSASSRLFVRNLHLSKCYRCRKFAVWVHSRILFPEEHEGPKANEDMPPEVCIDYDEARSIVNRSPRGAAALLRLAVEKLAIHLNAEGATLDDRISDLVSIGLDERIQQSLDIVRVIGNEAVHPGTLDLKDDPQTARKLLQLVNEIVEEMISKPKRVKELYESLPEEKRKGIAARDKKKK